MAGWRYGRPKQLKKLAFAMTESTLLKLIDVHESRGWMKTGEIKSHGYGVGCLMVWKGIHNDCEKVGETNEK